MSFSSSPVLVFELQHGWRRLLPAGTLLVAVLLFPWLAAAWSAPLRIVVVGLGLVLALSAAWQAGLGCAARRITRVIWDRHGEWHLHFAAGEPSPAVLAAGSWQTHWLMCFRWIDANGRRHGLLIWRAQLEPGDWHRWQLRLRLEGRRAGKAMPEALP